MLSLRTHLQFLLVAGFACASAESLAHGQPEVVVLKPVADAALYETVPTNNLGGTLNLPVGAFNNGKRGRALIRFDISGGLPSNSIVISAVLTINVSNVGAASPDPVFYLHSCLKPWSEGNKSGNAGALATTGEVTWNAVTHPLNLWSTPGGATNVDFVGPASGGALVSGTNVVNFASTPDMVSDVQSWLTYPDRNFGWVIISDGEAIAGSARRFYSREDTNNSPTLTVTYQEIETSNPLEKVEASNGYFLMHLNLGPDILYSVEVLEDLTAATNWQVLTNFPISSSFRHYILPDLLGTKSKRFFRVSSKTP